MKIDDVKSSDPQIAALELKDKPYNFPIGDGLYVRVTPSGGRLWRWEYRFEGKHKLMAFGKYPAIRLSQACEKHEAARTLLNIGKDPMAVKKAEKEKQALARENTFAVVAKMWHEWWQGRRGRGGRSGKERLVPKNPRHAAQTWRRIELDLLPRFGSRLMSEITPGDLVRMVKEVEKRAPDIARRSLSTVAQIYRYAIPLGLAESNPAIHFEASDFVERPAEKPFAHLAHHELPELLRKMALYRGKAQTRLAMELLALTFLRTSELIEGRWSEIDFKGRLWTIPKARMNMKFSHLVPLSTQAIQILETMKMLSGAGDFIFPGDWDQGKAMSNNTILHSLAAMGFRGRMTGHGWRHIASTWLHGQQFKHEWVELQLSHRENDSSAHYNFAEHLPQRRKMMQVWADHLDELRAGGKVLQMAGD